MLGSYILCVCVLLFSLSEGKQLGGCHTSWYINDNTVQIFGGNWPEEILSRDGSNLFNLYQYYVIFKYPTDQYLLEFDSTTKKYIKIPIFGDIPGVYLIDLHGDIIPVYGGLMGTASIKIDNQRSHAYNTVYIFGGIGLNLTESLEYPPDTSYNDVYMYHISNQTFVKLNIQGNRPSPRFDAKLIPSENGFKLVGGTYLLDEYYDSSIWEFNISTKLWNKTEEIYETFNEHGECTRKIIQHIVDSMHLSS